MPRQWPSAAANSSVRKIGGRGRTREKSSGSRAVVRTPTGSTVRQQADRHRRRRLSQAKKGFTDRTCAGGQLKMKSRQSAREIVVTLVHGTWARGAPWTADTSALHQHLKQKVPQVREVLVYEWTGENTHHARVEGAKGLAAHVEEAKLKYPRADHYIIAHSHGGNVAVYACSNDKFRRSIAGIACLSTPFIRAMIDWPAAALNPGGQLFVMSCFELALLWIGLTFGGVGFSWILHWQGSLVLKVLAGLVLLAFVLIVIATGINQLVDGDDDSSATEDLVSDVKLDEEIVSSVNLLIIRAPGDEASSALSSIHFASWVADRTYRLLLPIVLMPTRILDRMVTTRKDQISTPGTIIALDILAYAGVIVWAWAAYWALVSRFQYVNLANPYVFRLEGLWLVTLPILAVAAPLLVAGVVSVVLAIIGATCRVPFGFPFKVRVFQSRLAVETTPTGRCEIHLLRERPPDDFSGLAHSRTYEAGEAISVIADWLNRAPRKRSRRTESARRFS